MSDPKGRTYKNPVQWERRDGKWKASITIELKAFIEDADITKADEVTKYLESVDAAITAYGRAAMKRIMAASRSDSEGKERTE